VLADALGVAGCTDAHLLAHLRSPGPHVRGCWAVDLLLGKQRAMTEAEWLACTNPEPMLDFPYGPTHGQPRASKRKMRLFVVACARDLFAYRPEAELEPNGGTVAEFEAAIDRVEAFADGHGALPPTWTALIGTWFWFEHSDVFASAYAVFGVDPDCDVRSRPPLEAIKDFRVNPAHWLRDIFGPDPLPKLAAVGPKILASNQNVRRPRGDSEWMSGPSRPRLAPILTEAPHRCRTGACCIGRRGSAEAPRLPFACRVPGG
jgi:hypothetical protein